jgi:Raf kinase inhibitor-like YbhB/YbcL family protein
LLPIRRASLLKNVTVGRRINRSAANAASMESGAPAGTKSFALIVDDPDAPRGTFCHWAMFDISPTATGVSDEMPAGAHEAVNDFGRMGYGGPCPPPGHVHHYRFRLMALNVPRLNIPQRATCQDVQPAAEPHKLAEATLVGTYAR